MKPKQRIEGVHDSAINQAGHDQNFIYQGIQYPELRQVVIDIVKSQLFELSQQAEESKMERALQYEAKLTNRIAQEGGDALVSIFQRPDVQFAMRDSLKEFELTRGQTPCEVK